MFRSKFNTSRRKRKDPALIIALALLVGMILVNVYVKPHTKPDVVYPMVDQHIEWTGAGYCGIYGGSHD